MIKKWFQRNFMPKQQKPAEQAIKLGIKRSLEAQVIRACVSCKAPGVDENNKYVGEICPKCGATRPPMEELGEIWSKHGF